MVKKVLGDERPFTEAESQFVDVKYYFENEKKKSKKIYFIKNPKGKIMKSKKLWRTTSRKGWIQSKWEPYIGRSLERGYFPLQNLRGLFVQLKMPK